MSLPDKIFLVGMPGSGKTTLGMELAKKLNKRFIDLDEEIERHEKLTIPEIFKQKSEDYFRQTEKACLSNLIDQYRSFVLSTGGGTPCFFDSMDKMLASGMVIYVNVSLKHLVSRLEESMTKRPKFEGVVDLKEEVKKLLEKREHFYSRAQIELKGDQLQTEDLLNALNK